MFSQRNLEWRRPGRDPLTELALAKTPDPRRLLRRDTQGEEKLLVTRRGAMLELGVPAVHRVLIHPGGLQHLDPQLLVHTSRASPGSDVAQHVKP